jgi:hypothetical protein
MALDQAQKTSTDVLAVRMILGQLIVQIAAGAEDPDEVIQIMLNSLLLTAEMAKLRDLPDDQEDEMRQHLKDSMTRFFGSMVMQPPPPS